MATCSEVTALCALDEMHKRTGLCVAHVIGLSQSCAGLGAGGQHHRVIQETALRRRALG
jgi:hypothetical protein